MSPVYTLNTIVRSCLWSCKYHSEMCLSVRCEHDGSVSDGRPPQPSDSNDQLLHSFSDFISVFEAHVQHHGRVHLPQPQRVADLLQELQSALLPCPKPSVSPPPTYAEVVPYEHRHLSRQRSSSELLYLRRENEKLRQAQRQSERLSAQLKESQVRVRT